MHNSNGTTRSAGFRGLRNFSVRRPHSQNSLENLARSSVSAILPNLFSTSLFHNRSLIFFWGYNIYIYIWNETKQNQTLKDKGFPYTKVKCVSHFMCWLWSKWNNLGKSLNAFKSLSTVAHCSSSLGKLYDLKELIFKRVYLGTKSVNPCCLPEDFVRYTTVPWLSQFLASGILKACLIISFFLPFWSKTVSETNPGA